jgi:hypothetical protein
MARVPEFQSREEEAAFWDTHDGTGYLDELQPVRVRSASHLSTGMTVRLDPEDREAPGRSSASRYKKRRLAPHTQGNPG